MRVAAGILLIVGGVILLFMFVLSSVPFGGWMPYENLSDVAFQAAGLVWAGFILTGGIFTLKRKHWGLCLAASIVAVAILPIIFISLRKREWQAFQD